MVDYLSLIKKARIQERFEIIPYLKYRLQNRAAFYTEVKHIYSSDKLSIKKTTERKNTKKVNFEEFKSPSISADKRSIKAPLLFALALIALSLISKVP